MHRYLPPLLLLLVMTLVAVRCALEPSRSAGREHINGLVQGRQFHEAGERLAGYLRQFDEPEDRWFAARMYFRMGRPSDGIDVIWTQSDLAGQKETAKRFAETALFAAGWTTEDRSEPTSQEPRALTVLVEGGNAWAEERLRTHIRDFDLLPLMMYYFPAYRLATRRPMDVVTQVLRARGEEIFDVAAAMGSLQTEDYPEKASDVAQLKKVVLSADWRQRHYEVWTVACFALGRAGDAEALAALRQGEARMEGSSRVRDREDLLLLRNGLVAGGEWRVDEELAENALGPRPNMHAAIWYLEALIHRYREGDKRSELRLRQIWERLGARHPYLRHRQARAFLLQGDMPTAEAVGNWLDRMLRDLESDGADLMARVLARAYRLRKGEPGARERLIEILYEAGAALPAEAESSYDRAVPFIEALRALYLYG